MDLFSQIKHLNLNSDELMQRSTL